MISKVSINNFQSLKSVDIELGLFTVIVGNSSSGKSALVRALKAVSSNTRGSQFVTMGASTASVSVESQEWKITLEKGEGHGCYRLFEASTGTEKEYTKLAGGVPSDITDRLGISPSEEGKSVNFAGERESPYLLDESGQQVAKVLGDLTNVSTILEAVREANRRRTNTNSVLRVRQGDLENLKEKLPRFKYLPTRLKLIEQAEEYLTEAKSVQVIICDVTRLVTQLEKLSVKTGVVYIPDTAELETMYAEYRSYKTLLRSIQDSISRELKAKEEYTKLDATVIKLEEEYRKLLIEAGACPVCQSPIIQ